METDGAEGLRFRKDVPKRTQGPRQRKNSSVRACLVNQVNTCRTMKVIGIFVNMASAFGKHMESGLKNLRSVAGK